MPAIFICAFLEDSIGFIDQFFQDYTSGLPLTSSSRISASLKALWVAKTSSECAVEEFLNPLHHAALPDMAEGA